MFLHIAVVCFFLLRSSSPVNRYNLFYSIVDGHVACFYLLMTVSGATLHLHTQVLVFTPVFNSLGYIPRGGISGS